MAIYRGTGGASDSTDDSTISAVTTQAGIATTKASEAASSATDANTSATNAAASATAASGHASTSSDNATASSGSATDAAGFATAASNSATAASNSATAAANSASTANSAEVQAVAAKTTEITGVYNDIANVNTVAGNITDVNTVATNSSNITAVAADASDIGTVAGSISNVNTVGDNIANVNTVASNNTNINTVAADASDIGTVAGISGNVTTVAGISSDVTTVAGLESKMDTVIADASDIGTVAGNIGDVSTVAGISSDVDTVAGISADVTSVADNMTAVQNATTSATNAATSAASASDSASAAATSAGTASSSASDASTSETNAANSATSASNSATAASESKDAAASSAQLSGQAWTLASSRAYDAAASASNAANSETNAASSATAAAGSATAASGSASAAATSETNAAASESNANASKNAAATSATNAATSETNAAASYDSFDDRYLGVKSSAPSTDNDGGALLTGALYFNSTNNTMNVFTGSAWAPVANNNIINPNVALTQDLATNGNDVKFGDNDKATFGASNDLQIYHDGSRSYISDQGTGGLRLLTNEFSVKSPDESENLFFSVKDGSTYLYENGGIKLNTTATGIDVTGTATMDGLTVDGGAPQLNINSANPILIMAETDQAANSQKWGFQSETGLLKFRAFNDALSSAVTGLSISRGGDISFYEDTGTTPKLFWDASAESLGIGTSSPIYPLDVRAAGSAEATALRLSQNNYSVGGTTLIKIGTEPAGWSKGAIGFERTGAYDVGALIFCANNSISSADVTKADERMRIDSSGNVGVGTSSPTTKGHFYSSTAMNQLSVDGTGAIETGINFKSGGTTYGQIYFNNVSPYDMSVLQQYSTGSLIFGTNDTERLRIDSSGRVGIGTSSPSADLHVAGNGRFDNSASTPVRLHINNSGSNDYASIYADTATAYKNLVLNPSGGRVGIGTSLPAGVLDLGQVGSTGANTIFGVGAQSENYFTTNTSGMHVFRRGTTEDMRIDSSGRVGIGTSSPNAQLQLTGDIWTGSGTAASPAVKVGDGNTGFYYVGSNVLGVTTNGTERMRVDSSGNVGIGNTPSSARLLLEKATDVHLDIRSTGDHRAKIGSKANDLYIGHSSSSANMIFKKGIGENDHPRSSGTETMRIDSSGRVGIGTSSPSTYNAQLASFKDGGSFAYLGHNNSGGTFPKVSALSFGSNAVSYTHTTDGGTNALSGSAQIAAIQSASSNAVTDMAFYTTSGGSVAERLRIDSSGNVGIGTSSPARQFHLHNSSAAYLHLTNGTTGSTASDGASITMAGTSLQISNRENGVLQMYTNGTERMRIDSSGNVGIGTSSPSARLEVGNGVSSETIKVNAGAGWADVRLHSDATNGGSIYFNDGADAGQIFYYHVDNSMRLHTAATERMRIDSDGRALYGTTDTTLYSNTSGNGALINGGGGEMQIACNNGAPMWLNRMGNDGEIIKFYKAGTTVGSIGTGGGLIQIGQGNANLKFSNAADAITPANGSGSNNDSAIDLGATGARFKDLYLSGGVYLGGTGAANKLDDYEEGTFTATLKGSSEPASLVTSTSYYTKVGNKVHFEIGFENADTTGYSGDFFVTGLPFTSTGPRAVASVIHYKTTTWSDGHVPVAIVGSGQTTVNCLNQLSGSPWAVNQHSAGTGRYFWITGTYITTA